jgi:hypothetical protein
LNTYGKVAYTIVTPKESMTKAQLDSSINKWNEQLYPYRLRFLSKMDTINYSIPISNSIYFEDWDQIGADSLLSFPILLRVIIIGRSQGSTF